MFDKEAIITDVGEKLSENDTFNRLPGKKKFIFERISKDLVPKMITQKPNYSREEIIDKIVNALVEIMPEPTKGGKLRKTNRGKTNRRKSNNRKKSKRRKHRTRRR